MQTNVIIQGDALEVLKTIPDNSIDSIVTDPPYGLAFMDKKWDKFKDSAQYAEWCEQWARECLRVLKPGGHLLAFGGTRTYHALAWGIEQAGFEIRDMIEWLYLSGFPKGISNLGKINKELVGWGISLKPAHEPIVMARKPIEGTVYENVEKWGTGALNVASCRIGDEERENPQAGYIRRGRTNEEVFFGVDRNKPSGTITVKGRYPSNCVTLDENEWYSKYFNVTPRELSKKASKKDRGEYNDHPTVKPTALMAWLIRLVTPPGGIVLDPFAGSGSTLVAAKREGFRYIGIEMEHKYIEIAERRLIEVDGGVA